MRTERLALLTLSLAYACVQDVHLGLSDGGVEDGSIIDTGADTKDSGTIDTGADTGAPIGCEEETPRSCNADSECGEGSYCDNDFARRTGTCKCDDCTRAGLCGAGTIGPPVHRFGNGCGWSTFCECPPGTTSTANGCEGTGDWLRLDPASLTFFSLPTGTLRYAISGLDPDARTCATVIWTIGDLELLGAHCGDSSPYVVLTPNTDGPCGQWEYGPNVIAESATGCYDFAEFASWSTSSEPHQDLVDLEVIVTSTVFSGGIGIRNRTSLEPWPVSFVLRYTTDQPGESIWIQDGDVSGEQSWVRLYADGVRIPIGECEVMECGGSGGGCPAAERTARNIIRPGEIGGSATLTWDGWIYNAPTGAACMERQVAHPRRYEAEFCFGRTIDTSGGEEVVQNLECRRVEFYHPSVTNQVVLRVDEGG